MLFAVCYDSWNLLTHTFRCFSNYYAASPAHRCGTQRDLCVCLSVCVCVLGTRVSCAKRLNRSRCRLRGWLLWVKRTTYLMVARIPPQEGHFWGRRVWAQCNVPTHECIAMSGERDCPAHAVDDCIRRREGWQDKASCHITLDTY